MSSSIKALWAVTAVWCVCTAPNVSRGNAVNPERSIEIAVKVPTPAWSIKIENVMVDAGGYYVVSRLTKADGLTIQRISIAKAKVTFEGPDLPVKQHFVIGKTWGWENKEAVAFIDDEHELKKHIPANAKPVVLR